MLVPETGESFICATFFYSVTLTKLISLNTKITGYDEETTPEQIEWIAAQLTGVLRDASQVVLTCPGEYHVTGEEFFGERDEVDDLRRN